VWDVIGRAVVVTDGADDLGQGNHPRSSEDGNSGQRLVAFI
jgi:Copper/zinc superoxide dismutase (SODC).